MRSSSGTRRSSGCTTSCATAPPTTPALASSRSSTSRRHPSTRRAASSVTSWSTIRSRRRSPTGSSRRRSSERSRARRSSSATTSFQRNRQWLDVAVGRWREFDETLSPAGKRPVLFVMCENTQRRRRGRRLPAPACRLHRRPAAGDPHQPHGRDHQGRPRSCAPGRARRRRARQPDPLHRQRPDAARGLGRAQRVRDRHAAAAQRRQQDPPRAGARAVACAG